MPKNTFTALLPVTFPTLASAYLSWMAATLLANVSLIRIVIKNVRFITQKHEMKEKPK